MAEIPVQRKSGASLWPWLLGLLALLLLAFLLLGRGCNNAPVATVGDDANRNAGAGVANAPVNNNSATTNNSAAGSAAVTAPAGGRVTDVNLFGSTSEKTTLVGRRAELQNVTVNRVLSDRVFTVTSGAGEMFVLLDENLDTGGGREQKIVMRPGQIVNLGGTFQRIPTEEIKDERRRDLNAREYAQMAGQEIYLHGTDVKNPG